MNFNIYNILIIAGVIQGFIFTIIFLYNRKYHSKSTFFLVTLIFCYTIGNLSYILPDIGAMTLESMYNYLYLPLAAIDSPLIYFYVAYFLYPSKKMKWTDKLLFVPFIISLSLTIYFRIQFVLGNLSIEPINVFFKNVIVLTEMFSVIFSISLLVVTIHKTIAYDKQHKAFDRKVIRNDIYWLKSTLIIILVFTLLWAYLTYRNLFVKSGEVVFYSLWLGMAALIYWLGHIGLYKYGVFVDRKRIRKYLETHKSLSKNIPIKPNNLSNYHKNEYLAALENLLTIEKVYLNPHLSLENVAENLKLSPSYLSRIINSELKTSFPDYLNTYRIKEAESYLKNPEFSKYTISAIGLEAGFNSKSTFYEVFKKATGKTPRAYKKEILST